MQKSTISLSLDLQDLSTRQTVDLKRTDTGRLIRISLFDGGLPYRMGDTQTAAFIVQKPNGNIAYEQCSQEDFCLTYQVSPRITQVPGQMDCELSFYDRTDGSRMTGPTFTIRVEDTIFDSEAPVETPVRPTRLLMAPHGCQPGQYLRIAEVSPEGTAVALSTADSPVSCYYTPSFRQSSDISVTVTLEKSEDWMPDAPEQVFSLDVTSPAASAAAAAQSAQTAAASAAEARADAASSAASKAAASSAAAAVAEHLARMEDLAAWTEEDSGLALQAQQAAEAAAAQAVQTAAGIPDDYSLLVQKTRNLAILPEVSGCPITLEDASGQTIAALTLYGHSRQNGIPATLTPVPIQSAGESGNLTVTLTDGDSESCDVLLTNENHSQSAILPLRAIGVPSGGNVTIDGQHYIADTLEVHADGTGKVVKRCGEAVVSGTETVAAMDAMKSVMRFRVQLSDLVEAECESYAVNTARGICTHTQYLCANGIGTIEHVYCSGRLCYLFFSPEHVGTTPETAQAFVKAQYDAGTPITIHYVLKYPRQIPLTASEIQSVLALRTCMPVTQVFNDAEAHMSLTYPADTKTYIDNKFAQLAAAIVNNT